MGIPRIESRHIVTNNRPLGVDYDRGEGELVPITPNGLLQPANLQDVEEDVSKYEDTKGKYTHRIIIIYYHYQIIIRMKTICCIFCNREHSGRF